MAKLIKLTDWNSGQKELVDADQIARVQPYFYTETLETTQEETVGWGPFKRTENVEYIEELDRVGSKVVMKGSKDNTCVKETVEQIEQLIQGANRVTNSVSPDGISASVQNDQPANA